MKKIIFMIAALLCLGTLAEAKRISEYSAVDALADADKFLLSDTSASGREQSVTASALKAYINADIPLIAWSTGITVTADSPTTGTDTIAVSIDDTKGNGDTTYIWSADKVFDSLVAKASASESLTNKTIDSNGTGNIIKGYGYMTFVRPHNRGSATGAVGTTETTQLYGVPSFADDVETNNYVDYISEVPRDWDSTVEPVAYFKFRLGGADTGDHDYIISMVSVADSAVASGTPGTAIDLAYTADASGADGDIETATATLTGWGSASTAGTFWLIRVTRDGDDGTNDTSTVDSYPMELTIRYGFSQ